MNQITTEPGIVIADMSPRDFYSLPRRPYDYSRGDRRFGDLKRATDHAHKVASSTGVRQLVRPDTGTLGMTMFIVQAVGS